MVLKSIEENIDSIKIESQEGLTKPANYLFEMLAKCGVNFNKKNYLFEILQRLLQYFGTQTPNPRHHNGASLAKFNDFLQVTSSKQKYLLFDLSNESNQITPYSNKTVFSDNFDPSIDPDRKTNKSLNFYKACLIDKRIHIYSFI